MSIFGVWRNGFLQVDGVQLHDHAREISVETSVTEIPSSVHGDSVARVVPGLEDWTISVTFLQDFAAGEVDATLQPLSLVTQSVTGFPIIVGADSVAAVSATNPRYSGNAILASYSPMHGPHGSNLEATATFRCTAALTRTTA